MKDQLNEFLQKYEAGIFTAADQERDKPLSVLTEEAFSIYEKYDNRSIFENSYCEARRALTIYGLAAEIRHSSDDVRRLEEVINHICDEVCWAHPAHIDRSKDPDWRVYVDLFAAETGGVLADYINRFAGELSEEVCNRAKNEVIRRVLDPYCNSSQPYGSWEGGHNNWCAVCSGNVGCTALDLLKDDPGRLEKILERICKSLEGYLAGFSEEGISVEGVVYYNYGMIYYTEFAQRLYEYTNGKKDLMQGDKLKKIGAFHHKYFLNGGTSISFSDGGRESRYPLGLACYLVMKYSDAARIPDIHLANGWNGDRFYRTKGIFRNYFEVKKFLLWLETPEGLRYTGQESVSGQESFSGAQWSICQNREQAAAVCKGGNNDEPHNHNDVGSFFYLKGKDRFLEDLGAGLYTGNYFKDDIRYTILCNSSLGHSVPVINGQGQCAGKQYCADEFWVDGAGTTGIKFQSAYKAGIIQEMERILSFEEESSKLVMTDTFIPSAETECIEECLITQMKPKIDMDHIILDGREYRCIIRVQGNKGDIKVDEAIHLNHAGVEEPVYRILWQVMPAKAGGDGELYASSISCECVPINRAVPV